ncbi:MAG: CopG family ribbon-helix-helix protein [Methermicoccaceae archaeon]
MTIISVSLSDALLSEIDKAKKELGFSGRSELIRAGVRKIIADNKDIEKLSGRINSVLLVAHNQQCEGAVSELKHEFDSIIQTQLHSHLKNGKCLDVFILDGDAAQIRSLVKSFQASGKMDYIGLDVT